MYRRRYSRDLDENRLTMTDAELTEKIYLVAERLSEKLENKLTHVQDAMFALLKDTNLKVSTIEVNMQHLCTHKQMERSMNAAKVWAEDILSRHVQERHKSIPPVRIGPSRSLKWWVKLLAGIGTFLASFYTGSKLGR